MRDRIEGKSKLLLRSGGKKEEKKEREREYEEYREVIKKEKSGVGKKQGKRREGF